MNRTSDLDLPSPDLTNLEHYNKSKAEIMDRRLNELVLDTTEKFNQEVQAKAYQLVKGITPNIELSAEILANNLSSNDEEMLTNMPTSESIPANLQNVNNAFNSFYNVYNRCAAGSYLIEIS